MPVLKNARHERMAQGLAKGLSAEKAHVEAGFKQNRHNAAALARDQHILTRVQELQGKAAEKAGVTIQSLTDELEQARGIAIAEKQSSAAVAATMGKAKLHGLLIEKKRLEGPDGGPVKIDLTGYSIEQLQSLEQLLGSIAGSTGSDTEAGESGDSEADG